MTHEMIKNSQKKCSEKVRSAVQNQACRTREKSMYKGKMLTV